MFESVFCGYHSLHTPLFQTCLTLEVVSGPRVELQPFTAWSPSLLPCSSAGLQPHCQYLPPLLAQPAPVSVL